MAMEAGFNSDITHSGRQFHVQTEDWGDNNPYIVTRIFQSGAVLVSLKTAYSKILGQEAPNPRLAVRLAMREQHQRVLDQLVSGTLNSDSLK